MACSADEVAYLPVGPSPAGLDDGILWYEPDQQRMVALPRTGGVGLPDGPAIARFGGDRIIWPFNGEELLVLHEGANAWVRVKKPIAGPVDLAHIGADLLLVDPTWSQRPPAQLTLGLVDVSKLLAAG